eukprot:2975700-Rhodomonas_salina.1
MRFSRRWYKQTLRQYWPLLSAQYEKRTEREERKNSYGEKKRKKKKKKKKKKKERYPQQRGIEVPWEVGGAEEENLPAHTASAPVS